MVTRVAVVGAGYAGMSAVRRLSRSEGLQVALINPRPDFVERIRLHQMMVGNHDAIRPLYELLPKEVELITANVDSIDGAAQRLSLDNGTTSAFDYLVFAIGSRSRPSDIRGAHSYACTVDTLESARATASRLRALDQGARVTVVGGGLTGIEVAAELAEHTTISVRLITRGPVGSSLGRKARECVRTHFEDHGLDLIEHEYVQEITATEVVLSSGRTYSSDLTIVAPAFEVPDLARSSGLIVDKSGALVVDEALISVANRTIIGAGDAAVLTSDPIRMSCQAAIPLGVHAAETVLHLLAGKDPKRVERKFVGQCISLGRHQAVFQPTNRADRSRDRPVLTGRAGAAVKERICASTLTFGRVGGFHYSWSN